MSSIIPRKIKIKRADHNHLLNTQPRPERRTILPHTKFQTKNKTSHHTTYLKATATTTTTTTDKSKLADPLQLPETPLALTKRRTRNNKHDKHERRNDIDKIKLLAKHRNNTTIHVHVQQYHSHYHNHSMIHPKATLTLNESRFQNYPPHDPSKGNIPKLPKLPKLPKPGKLPKLIPKLPTTRQTGYFRNTSPPNLFQTPNYRLTPFVVMTSKRHLYLEQTIESLRVAHFSDEKIKKEKIGPISHTAGKKRVCVFIVDRTPFSKVSAKEKIKIDDAIKKAADFCDSVTCARTEPYDMRTSYEAMNVHQQIHSMHLKSHWVWGLSQIFEIILDRYDGDVLILEDDVLVSPDVFHVVDYASAYRRSGYGDAPVVTALGGWNGEHLFAPHPHHLRTIQGRAFPTLGYAFNRTLFRKIKIAMPRILHPSAKGDWTGAVSNALEAQAIWQADNAFTRFQERQKHKRQKHRGNNSINNSSSSVDNNSSIDNNSISISNRKKIWTKDARQAASHFYLLQPTLSRVHHIGATSQVGNSHASYLRDVTPWSKVNNMGGLLSSPSLGKHLGTLSNLQGLPCRSNKETTTVYDDLRTLVFESGVPLPAMWVRSKKIGSKTIDSFTGGKRYSEFAYLLFDSMFDHDKAHQIDGIAHNDVEVDNCRLLPVNYPSCNPDSGRTNRWCKTFYPNKFRWDVTTASNMIDKVLRKQARHLFQCQRITPQMLKLWPKDLPR